MIHSGLQRSGFRQKATCPKCHRRDVPIRGDKIGPHLAPGGRQRCYPGEEPVVATRQKRMKPGRKSELERKVEAIYSALWEAQGLTVCELQCSEECWRDDYRQWAHLDKRKYCSIEEWLCGVVLACQNCHSQVEALPRLEMREVITHVIEERGWRPTVFTFRDLWPELSSYFGGRWYEEIEPIIEKGANDGTSR